MPWRVGLEWQATHGTLLYGLISRGFKAGSFPLINATTAGNFRTVKQEELTDYEIGIKSRLFDNKVSVNAGVFYYDYRDKQLLARIVDPVFGSLQALANVPKSHVKGAEASFGWTPATGLKVDGAAVYLKSKVTSNFANSDPYGDAVNYQGEGFPYTPKWSLSGGARYEWPLSARINTYVTARGSYQTSTVGAFGEPTVLALGYPSFKVPAYGLVDLSVGVEPNGNAWRVEAWVRNVANTYYITSVLSLGENASRLTGMPRTFGMTVSYKY